MLNDKARVFEVLLAAHAFEFGRFQLLAVGGKAQEDETHDVAGIFLVLEAGVDPELISGIPEAPFELSGSSVFLKRGDPVHG